MLVGADCAVSHDELVGVLFHNLVRWFGFWVLFGEFGGAASVHNAVTLGVVVGHGAGRELEVLGVNVEKGVV